MKKTMIFACAALMALAGCSKKEAAQAVAGSKEQVAEVVETMVLKPRTIQRELQLSTNLQGYQTVNVSPSLQGKIEHIYVEVGDRKGAGDMLVRMDQNQYNTTKLAMSNLEIEKMRVEALLETGSVSKQQYDQIQLSYNQTKESLSFLETNTYVRAPFSGIVSAKNYEDGELYAGQPIVVLTQVNKLKALIAVPESYVPQVKKGMSLTLESTIYPGKTFPATIEVVYPTIDATSHTFQCKLAIPNGQELLRPGMYVTTNLKLGEQSVITAPYSTVLKLIGANDRYVFVNENGKAKRVSVEMGQRFGDDVEISGEGIEEGVELIVKGEARLIDGVAINVVNK